MDISEEVCKDCVVLPMCNNFCDNFRAWADQWIADAKSDMNSSRMVYLKSVDPTAYEALYNFVKNKTGVCITHPRTNKLIMFDEEGVRLSEITRLK
jgi:hypothetical protein